MDYLEKMHIEILYNQVLEWLHKGFLESLKQMMYFIEKDWNATPKCAGYCDYKFMFTQLTYFGK